MTKNRVLVMVGVFFLGAILIKFFSSSFSNNDFKIGTINEDGMYLRNISFERKMVNSMEIKSETEVWIPKGLGWYKSGKVEKILKQENKLDMAPLVFFYNFGFTPDIVVYDNQDNWLNNLEVIKKWGVVNYLYFRWVNGNLMYKDDNLSDQLSEVIPRDFADSRILKEDMRVSIYNASAASGMANFISRNLEWSGVTVVGVENYNQQVDMCIIRYGQASSAEVGFKLLKKIFPECKWEVDSGLTSPEVELYLGDKFAQMLNYQSYNHEQ